MRFPTSQRLLTGAVALAALCAALPERSQAAWSGAVSVALWAPLWPATALLSLARNAIRPSDPPYEGLPEALRDALSERDRLQGEFDAASLRLRQVETELGELTGYRPGREDGWRPRLATVVQRSAGRPPGLFVIDQGPEHGVDKGDPVVVGGNRLVGLVAGGSAGAGRSLVIPLDDRRAGRIDAVVMAPPPAPPVGAKPPSKPPAAVPVLVQLLPAGNGRLIGEFDPSGEVKPGDPVILSDATWKPGAQGMRIGTVEAVGVLDANPLRRRVEVRMDADPARVGRVVVKVSAAGAPAGGQP
jgi:cell shape-determining protein MreC